MNLGRLLAAEVKASTSCTGGGWGKTVAIRENEEKSVWAAITRVWRGTRGWKGGRLEVGGNAVMGQERCGGDGKKKKKKKFV